MLIQLINLLSSQFEEESIGKPVLDEDRAFTIEVPHPNRGIMYFTVFDSGLCCMSWVLDDSNYSTYEGTHSILQVAVNIGHLSGTLRERYA